MRKAAFALLAFLVASRGAVAVAQTTAPQSISSLDATVAGLESIGLFIPESRLVNPDGTMRKHALSADLKAHRFDEALSRGVQGARKRILRHPEQPCVFPSGPGVVIRDEQAERNWRYRLARTDLTIRGRVVRVTPGLNTQTFGPANLVVVDVTRSLRGEKVVSGSPLTFLTTTGSLTIDGVQLCTADEAERVPVAGDDVFVSGWIQTRRPGVHIVNKPSLDVWELDRDNRVTVRGPDGGVENLSVDELEDVVRAGPRQDSAQSRQSDLQSILSLGLGEVEHGMPVVLVLSESLDAATRAAASSLRSTVPRTDIPVSAEYKLPGGFFLLDQVQVSGDAGLFVGRLGPVPRQRPGILTDACGTGYRISMTRHAGQWTIGPIEMSVC